VGCQGDEAALRWRHHRAGTEVRDEDEMRKNDGMRKNEEMRKR
jgi:hypothetical protein